ncbi:hypothetical protein [Persephonella sp.]
MLTENEKRFINQRLKIGKLGSRFIVMIIFVWILLYAFIIFKLPFMVYPDYFDEVLVNFNDFRLIMLVKLAPVFFNLFMITLLLLFILMLVFLNVERDYLKILKKILKEEKAS